MAFLIPIGVVFYAAVGGLKSTFTTSYVHTGGHVPVGMAVGMKAAAADAALCASRSDCLHRLLRVHVPGTPKSPHTSELHSADARGPELTGVGMCRRCLCPTTSSAALMTCAASACTRKL